MEGVVRGACVQILALIVAVLSPSAHPLARVVEPVETRGCPLVRPSAETRGTDRAPEGPPPPLRPRAMGMLGKVGGAEFKVSFYRGLGGGLRVVSTDGGVALTFEGGVGIGGSFSAGTADRLPKAGAAAEGRVSLSSRFLPVQPPDFGATLDDGGKLQGYTDVKTGKFRTRFHSEPLHLLHDGDGDGDDEGGKDAPVVRRSWSLGSEFKVAFKYTFRGVWDDILTLLVKLARYFPTAGFLHVPFARPADPHPVHANLDHDCAVRAVDFPPGGAACRAAPPPRAGNVGLLMSRYEKRRRNARSRRTPRPRTGTKRRRPA
ncbi:hypothetical protein [Actinomadura sp. WMMB 499]|uniref:hypothetical protein n=1 Tax=Actinomadura sp. WMMB 499 TaxID=1219491 RepID=UPI001245848A|nr:hypothetical protein [Actinomadura sp. WMMB 499]QFG23677.1 hypothetical protein F7P10_23690 [Actinomadura sp. WMMB 499]